jgi:hypothetical protein
MSDFDYIDKLAASKDLSWKFLADQKYEQSRVDSRNPDELRTMVRALLEIAEKQRWQMQTLDKSGMSLSRLCLLLFLLCAGLVIWIFTHRSC